MATEELIPLEQVEEVLLHGGDIAVVSEEAVQENIIRRILAAESIADAFGNVKSTPVRDIEGQLVAINGVAWMRSAFKEGPKVYALLDVTVAETGERLTVSMGGRTLMAGLLWAQRQEAMPFRGSFKYERSRSDPEKSYLTFVLAPEHVTA